MDLRSALRSSPPWERVRAMRADIRAARARSEETLALATELRAGLGSSHQMADQTSAELAALSHRIEALNAEVGALREQLQVTGDQAAADHQRTIDALRIVRDDDARAWDRLWQLRAEEEYELAFSEPEPLVTIIITTYSNWALMRDRAIPSVLAQTYGNWECLVVGDAAPPAAAEVVASFNDARLRFVNLPYRGPYPPDREQAWLVSGTLPFNTGMALTRGRWIGSVSDDDALVPGYVETLLGLARQERAEVAYGRLRAHYPDRPSVEVGVFPPEYGTWGTQNSLFHSCVRFLPMNISDWRFGIPNDWSWAERMLRIGVRFAMVDRAMVEHYPSHDWIDRPQMP